MALLAPTVPTHWGGRSPFDPVTSSCARRLRRLTTASSMVNSVAALRLDRLALFPDCLTRSRHTSLRFLWRPGQSAQVMVIPFGDS